MRPLNSFEVAGRVPRSDPPPPAPVPPRAFAQFAAAMKRGQNVSGLRVKQVQIDDPQNAAKHSGWRKTTNRSVAQAISESQ